MSEGEKYFKDYEKGGEKTLIEVYRFFGGKIAEK